MVTINAVFIGHRSGRNDGKMGLLWAVANVDVLYVVDAQCLAGIRKK